MLNEIKVTVAGNVTRPPEVKHRKLDGRAFTVVPMAVNGRRYDTQSGQWVEDGTTFYDIICRNGLGANVLASLKVGDPVLAYGKFRVHEWSTDTMRGARPTLVADSLGIALNWGTTSYERGMRAYPDSEGHETEVPPPDEGGPGVREVDGHRVDADGVVHDDPSAGESSHGPSHDELPDGLPDGMTEEDVEDAEEEAGLRAGVA